MKRFLLLLLLLLLVVVIGDLATDHGNPSDHGRSGRAEVWAADVGGQTQAGGAVESGRAGKAGGKYVRPVTPGGGGGRGRAEAGKEPTDGVQGPPAGE